MRILHFLGSNPIIAGIGLICTVAGLGLAIWQLPATADSPNIKYNFENIGKSDCAAYGDNARADCKIVKEEESFKVQNSMMGYTNLLAADVPWDSTKTGVKLANGTKVKILKQLDNESPTAAIALVEVVDGPHAGMTGKVNMALVTRN